MKLTGITVLLLPLITCITNAQDTIHVKTGWNLIGSLKGGTSSEAFESAPPGNIISSFFGYLPDSGYESTDTLRLGLGYWVKVNQDGLIIFSSSLSVEQCGVARVIYNGEIYHTVKIGTQCWLEENLDVGTMITGGVAQLDNDTIEKYCYDDSLLLNCPEFGGLYQWSEAMLYDTLEGTRGVCPPGWHIPTLSEYQELSSTVGGNGYLLRSNGYAPTFGGIWDAGPGVFGWKALGSYYWTSTSIDDSSAYYMVLPFNTADINFISGTKNLGVCIRCVRD